MTRLNSRFLLALIASAILAPLLFLPGLGGGFIFDDKPNIVQNTSLHIQGSDVDDLLYATYSFQPGNGSRALTMFSFAVDYWRGGLDARGFKVTNLLIHGLTTLALGLLIRQLFLTAGQSARRAAVLALLVALLWAVHPLQVSSVLYVVQRMQTLVTLFMVLAMLAYACMRREQLVGGRSRFYGVLTVLFWVLGFASKEDALLFPAYAFLLELTLFRFRAAQPTLAKMLRKGYVLLVLTGSLLYLLWMVPHYWRWDAYPGRDFSSYERLLTQGRVLAMYLGQILWPDPHTMPFYYDQLSTSRGLLKPVSTLASLVLLSVLLFWAWTWRQRRPLFSFGVLLFFAGHFMTSNVLNLEMAFEHRNHLPMIGILLALVDLLSVVLCSSKIRLARPIGGIIAVALLGTFAASTLFRAHVWGEPLRFAETSVELSPRSERAWLQLGNVYAERSNLNPASPDFRRALDVCREGAEITDSAPLWSNVVIYKSIAGDAVRSDWDRLIGRVREVPMSAQNQNLLWAMLGNVDRGVPLDEVGMLQLIDVMAAKTSFQPSQYFRLAAYIHNETHSPRKALPFLKLGVEASPRGDPEVAKILEQLDSAGRSDWVSELKNARSGKE